MGLLLTWLRRRSFLWPFKLSNPNGGSRPRKFKQFIEGTFLFLFYSLLLSSVIVVVVADSLVRVRQAVSLESARRSSTTSSASATKCCTCSEWSALLGSRAIRGNAGRFLTFSRLRCAREAGFRFARRPLSGGLASVRCVCRRASGVRARQRGERDCASSCEGSRGNVCGFRPPHLSRSRSQLTRACEAELALDLKSAEVEQQASPAMQRCERLNEVEERDMYRVNGEDWRIR